MCFWTPPSVVLPQRDLLSKCFNDPTRFKATRLNRIEPIGSSRVQTPFLARGPCWFQKNGGWISSTRAHLITKEGSAEKFSREIWTILHRGIRVTGLNKPPDYTRKRLMKDRFSVQVFFARPNIIIDHLNWINGWMSEYDLPPLYAFFSWSMVDASIKTPPRYELDE